MIDLIVYMQVQSYAPPPPPPHTLNFFKNKNKEYQNQK